MEKIKITVEQEKALKRFKHFDYELIDFIESRKHLKYEYESLEDLTPEQFALLLCGWYEVEQPFKVRDWIFDKEIGKYYKIIDKSDEMTNRTTYLQTCIDLSNITEKVTEQWKIMLLELGREKPEFRKGDAMIDTDGSSWLLDNEIIHDEFFLETANSGEIDCFYPVENRIEVQKNV